MDYEMSTNVASGRGLNPTWTTQTSAPAQPLGRVTESHESTRRIVEHLHQEIGLLEQRLVSVLRPPAPTSTNNAAEKRVEPSPLAGSIEDANRRLSDTVNFVQSLTARIDL